MRLLLDEEVTDLDWRCELARARIHAIVDARCAAAHRVIKSLAERDRRGLGQLTRWDHVARHINRRIP